MSIAICIIAAILEFGAGGFLCFRGMREKKICSRLLGIVGSAVLTGIAFYVFCIAFYDEQLIMGIAVCILAVVICGILARIAVRKYLAAIRFAAVAALFVVCITIIMFIGEVDEELAVGIVAPLALDLSVVVVVGVILVCSKRPSAYAVLVTFWGVWLVNTGFVTVISLFFSAVRDLLEDVITAAFWSVCLLLYAPYEYLDIMVPAIVIGVVGVCVQRRQRKKKGEIVDSGCEGEAADSGTDAEDEPKSNETNTESQ